MDHTMQLLETVETAFPNLDAQPGSERQKSSRKKQIQRRGLFLHCNQRPKAFFPQKKPASQKENSYEDIFPLLTLCTPSENLPPEKPASHMGRFGKRGNDRLACREI